MNSKVTIVSIIIVVVIVGGIFYFIQNMISQNNDIEKEREVGIVNNTQTKTNEGLAINVNTDFKIQEPTFGKVDKYYYRGQPEPLIDIVLYNKNLIFYNDVLQVLIDFPSYTRLILKHFPMIGLYRDAENFNEALECAGEQGKFWQYIDYVKSSEEFEDVFLRGGGQPDSYFVEKDVASIGIDKNKFSQCVLTEKYKDKVVEIYNEAHDSGITGSPTTFVNQQVVQGANEDELRKTINQELRQELMQSWQLYEDLDKKFSIKYTGNFKFNKMEQTGQIERVDFVNQDTLDVIMMYIYSDNGFQERKTEVEAVYETDYFSLLLFPEEQHWVAQILIDKNNNKEKYRLIRSFYRKTIVDGFDTILGDLNVEFVTENRNDLVEFVNLLGVSLERI